MIKLADFVSKTTTENTYYTLKRDGIKYKLVLGDVDYSVIVIAGNAQLKPKVFDSIVEAIDYITLLCKLNNIDTYATAMEEYKRRS